LSINKNERTNKYPTRSDRSSAFGTPIADTRCPLQLSLPRGSTANVPGMNRESRRKAFCLTFLTRATIAETLAAFRGGNACSENKSNANIIAITSCIPVTERQDEITVSVSDRDTPRDKGLRVSGGRGGLVSASRIEFMLGSTRASNMHTGNFESAALPGNLRQDGVYMTNDRIPYAKKSTLPRRLLSSPRSLVLSTLILFIPSGGGGGARARAPDTLITHGASSRPSPSLLFRLFPASSRIPGDIMSARVMETDG